MPLVHVKAEFEIFLGVFLNVVFYHASSVSLEPHFDGFIPLYMHFLMLFSFIFVCLTGSNCSSFHATIWVPVQTLFNKSNKREPHPSTQSIKVFEVSRGLSFVLLNHKLC